jgi:DNA modification methylase
VKPNFTQLYEPSSLLHELPWHDLRTERFECVQKKEGLCYHLQGWGSDLQSTRLSRVWIIVGDNRVILPVVADLFPGQIHGCVTSPPYFGQRDNGCGEEQIGLGSFQSYIDGLDIVHRSLFNILSDRASLWDQIGNKSAGGGNGPRGQMSALGKLKKSQAVAGKFEVLPNGYRRRESLNLPEVCRASGRRAGFLNPDEIVWDKGIAAPRSNPTVIRPSSERIVRLTKTNKWEMDRARLLGIYPHCVGDVWRFPPNPNEAARIYGVDHTSTYPPDIAAACLALTTRPSDWVCDPFGGLGNTALGALKVGLNCILIEQNPSYALCAADRLLRLPACFRPRVSIILTQLK